MHHPSKNISPDLRLLRVLRDEIAFNLNCHDRLAYLTNIYRAHLRSLARGCQPLNH